MFRKICKFNNRLTWREQNKILRMQAPKFVGPNTGKEDVKENKPGFFIGVVLPMGLAFLFLKWLIYWYGK
jgi:hypothetical protein